MSTWFSMAVDAVSSIYESIASAFSRVLNRTATQAGKAEQDDQVQKEINKDDQKVIQAQQGMEQDALNASSSKEDVINELESGHA